MFTIRLSLEFLLEKLGKNSKLSRFLKFVLSEQLCEWKSALRYHLLFFTARLIYKEYKTCAVRKVVRVVALS